MTMVRDFARVRTLGSLYYSQAESSYLRFLELDKEWSASPVNSSDEGYFRRREAYSLAGIQTVVFSAMVVEAAAYDYAAVHLGDDFVLQHLDKLDVVSKWMVSLRLISNYEMPKHGALFASLRCLIRARNRLVHIKSEEFDDEVPLEQLARLKRESQQAKRDVHEAFRCLMLMSLTLQKVAIDAALHLPMRYWEHSLEFDPLPVDLKAIFDECRRIVAAAT